MNDKENYSPSKKARKSLASNWASSSGHTLNSNSLTTSSATGLHMRLAHHDHSSSFEAPETPSKSLVGTSDASMLFSPPAILKETALPDDSGAGFSSTDSLNMQESNYSSNQSASMSHNSFGGPKPFKNPAKCSPEGPRRVAVGDIFRRLVVSRSPVGSSGSR